MLTVKLPPRLREEFERSARAVYDQDSVARALAEAAELWLAVHRDTTTETAQTANDRAYESLKADLEREHWGRWVAIAHGRLQGVGGSLEEADRFAPNARDRIIMQVGQDRPQEVDLGWEMMFG